MSRPTTVHQKTVLIIEDEEDIQILLEYNLREKAFILQATDGEEGLLQAVEYRPDLILLDWMLPLCLALKFCASPSRHQRHSGDYADCQR